jgi:hypothetical protein
MTTELTEIWNAAGSDANGQLGVADKTGAYPSLSPVIDKFAGINNGELPDSEKFISISKELSNNEYTVFKATNGKAYISGQYNSLYDDKAKEGGTKSPRRSELLNNLPEAERLSLLSRIIDAKLPIAAGNIKELLTLNRASYSTYDGWTKNEPLQVIILTDSTVRTVDSYGQLGEATDIAGNLITGITKVVPVRVTYEANKFLHPIIITSEGGLWFPIEGTANYKRVVASGVTDVAQDNTDGLLVLKDSKLYRIYSFNFIAGTLTESAPPIKLRNIAGGKTWARLYGTETSDEQNETYNNYLLEEDGTLWVKGTNTYGELGTRPGIVSNWTRYITSSKVEEVIPRAEYTFIKKKA